ncbi:mini-chromosome maintenance complex-binding protein isoform X2 [Neltuma alba]|uniref:mini-chromosome maintenance complex-binding protein isoform X2 n=1 Tax=Neltuma alba TaxID=207710 RepID=UPI0010A4DC3E|nr:mini-chromosome maintenance complex-binding protein-like isoform X2 [Prosopis alba]
MVGPPYDFLVNPLGVVRSTFEKAIASGSDPASFDAKDWGAIDLFSGFLFDQPGLSRVPVLTPATLRWVQPNTLVRFRGMIQDMIGNELYVGAYKDGSVWRTNKFMDVAQFPMGSSADMRIWERRLLYCVPVPGQNAWTEISTEVTNQYEDWTFQQREKRRRADVSADTVQGSPDTKKMREDEHTSLATQSQGALPESSSSGMSIVQGCDGNSLPCLVKIYDSPESDLKLNDVFEFVGILASSAEPPVGSRDSEFSDDFCDDPLQHFPANKVPRLHCFVHRKLAVSDFLQNNPIIEPKSHLIREIREALLRHLTSVLGNDAVAAHYLLLHLLSRVHARADTLAVGKLSLNLTCFSKETMSAFGNILILAVKNLLPFTHCIPLTVEYLNTTALAPRKDYDTNRLVTGALQLAEGTHLIVDETKLKAGALNSVGVENARLLKNLMEFQKLEYDFKYYKMEMATDVQLLVMSEGKSNILPADVVVPFRPSVVNATETVVGEALDSWRWYLATVRQLPHSIESEMQKVVENDLVAARQADRSLNPQDLSKWLTMGRLMSLSFGETSLSPEHWQMVNELETLRSERLK